MPVFLISQSHFQYKEKLITFRYHKNLKARKGEKVMRKLYKEDVVEILYGATLLGAGGGGSLTQGLDMLKNFEDNGGVVELTMLEPDEMADGVYAAMVAGLGSPVAMLDSSLPPFGPDGVYAFKAFQKAYKAEGKEVKYLMSGEMGGFNTFAPMLVALNSDEDPEKRIQFIDADLNGRAVPELNTTLTTYYNHPTTPLGLGSWNGNEIVVYPVSDHDGELIARQLCMMYNMRIGFSTWGVNKNDIKNDLVPGCVTKAQDIGKAIFAAKNDGTDIMDELKKVAEFREFCRGTIASLEVKAEGGFDFGTTVIEGDDGHTYYIDFKNENLILRDENKEVKMTAPDGIGLINLDTMTPMTNADTKEGMRLLVTMTPAHPNWWDEDHKAYTCWQPELERVGYSGNPVRY